ncbi:amino acid adenylation domain-containing protein [Pedobacter sp. PF22-3]|uniref:non-ribosomal peptide synthetase n=1 Tax=Pedobacter sp. PF22-3 TaxID=2994467 RepID=UPI0022457688|nr:non-ribosomal peptide synthetase [Pedobacter sp. PF22-3]MCX2492860.1 amino acid adenylation domain-containing protein [Pedobacter sp. PF22-3]
MLSKSTLDIKGLKANGNFIARNYWKERLEGLLFRAYFTGDSAENNSAGKQKQYSSFTAIAERGEQEKLNQLAASPKARYLVLLAALAILAKRYAAVDEVCLLTALPSGEGAINPDEGIIPVRIKAAPGDTFRHLLVDLKNNISLDFNQGNYPLNKILATINGTGPGLPLTAMLFSEMHDLDILNELEPDLLFSFSTGPALSLTIRYNANIYDQQLVELLPGLYFNLLKQLIDQKDTDIERIELAPESEQKKILDVFNHTTHHYPAEENIAAIFENRVKQHPDAIALIDHDKQYSYESLNKAANRLSSFLLAQQLELQKPVAVMLNRSAEFVISILAILKAGGVYMPVNPAYPAERVNYMLSNSKAGGLISTRDILNGFDISYQVNTVLIDRDKAEISSHAVLNPSPRYNKGVYVIYTSGSTGEPRGITGLQKGLLNRLHWGWETYPFEANEVCCQKTNISFVDHVAEIFSPLLKGVPLVIISEDETSDIYRFMLRLKAAAVSRLTLVPSLLQALVAEKKEKQVELPALKQVTCSGEVLTAQLVQDFYGTFTGVKLLNVYGSSEVSADVSCYETSPSISGKTAKGNQHVPIGKPMYNTKLAIVNKNDQLQPIGVPGEIIIAGDAVVSGYHHDPELTALKFGSIGFFPQLPVFRSGDVGRWLPDGNIEYLGRLDHQVKLRGMRIRLGEIEQALLSYSTISEAVVVTTGEGNDRYLAAYYKAEKPVNIPALKKHILHILPDYMLPSSFNWLTALPLTLSGKINRFALPAPQMETGEVYEPASGELEEKLVEIWAAILKTDQEKISVNDSFFDLGGHSLRAMTLVNRIQGELGMDLSIKKVFENKTIRNLARLLQHAGKATGYMQLQKTPVKNWYALSTAQMRLYYFYELDRQSLTFNLPAVVKLEGILEHGKVENVLTMLIRRHESLRTRFEVINGRPMQQVLQDFTLDITYLDSTEQNLQQILTQFIRPFDLSVAPLFRVGLIAVSAEVHYLVADMHHIIADGTSVGLIINDFMALYDGVELLPLTFDYKDFAEWQQGKTYQDKIAVQKDFWIKEFSAPLTPLDIPVDFARTSSTEGDWVGFELNETETSALRALADQEVATISMVILSVLTILLSKMSDQDDITVGMAVAGREQLELEQMIGMFSLVLPLRAHPSGNLSFREYLQDLKDTFLDTFDNQSYQYEELARELNLERDSSRNPWFDVMYLYQNFERSALVIPGLKVTPYQEQNVIAHEKLNLTVSESNTQLFFRLVYSKALFKRETIEKLAGYFKRIIRAVNENADLKIASIELINTKERQLLLQSITNLKPQQSDTSFAAAFARQVSKTPHNIAVQHNYSSLTYIQLDTQAKKAASFLAANGAAANKNVAVLLPRGIDLVIAATAIFYSGAAYIPIDIDFPVQRMTDMLQSSEPVVLMTTRQALAAVHDMENITALATAIFCMEDLVNLPDADFNPVQQNINDLAYVIYTSGTTGKPKGAMVSQKGMMNHLWAMIDILGISSSDVIAQTASACFDISIWQLLNALLTGGKTLIIDKEKLQSPKLLLQLLLEEEITIFQTVPSLLSVFLEELVQIDTTALPQLRWMIPTGEALSVALVKKWQEIYPGISLLNAYGPAEASDDVTTYVVPPPAEGQLFIPIGRPVQNMHAYVLDKNNNLCPPGVKGEISVAGWGVGEGYWKDPEKTNKVFVPNPFIGDIGDPAFAVMYKTGDIGYYLDDYNLICLGRSDDQVKIRGFRIEPGEIESILLTYAPIREIKVMARNWADNKYLVAYYVSDEAIDHTELEQYLADKLPLYMIPAYFIHLEQFPVTLNGKINKRALPVPEIQQADFKAPEGKTEEQLALMWANVLGLQTGQISAEASFFSMGGHSLNAITLINSVYKQFNVQLSLKDFFMKPTIRSMADYLDAHLWLKKENPVTSSTKSELLL